MDRLAQTVAQNIRSSFGKSQLIKNFINTSDTNKRIIMNDIKNKIRGYNRREPIRDKKFAFSNDLISRAVYSGNNGRPDKRFDLKTEGLSLWIRANGIKTFYAFRKREMFNKNKLKIEKNTVYKKIFRYEETIHRNLAATKDALPGILKELSAPKLENKQDHSFGSMAKDFLKNGLNNYRLADRGEKFEYKEATKRKYRKLINSYILLKGHKDIVERLSSPLVFKEKFYTKPFKDLQMKDISVREIEVLQHRLSSTKTLSNDVLRIVSVIYSWANANDKYKGSNPVRSVVKFASNKIRVKLSDYEVKQLIDHCSSKAFDFDPRFLSLVHLDLLNGKRGSELFGIRWNAPTNDKELKECSGWLEDDWRKPGSYIYLHDTKNRKPEKVFIDQESRKVLLRLERSRFTEANKAFVKSPFLFPQRKDISKHITGSSLAKKINDLNEKFGWRYEYDGKVRNKFTLKIARKTFGSKIAEKQGIEIASRKLNHSDIQVTKNHYIVPEDKALEIENVYEENNIEVFENIKKVK